VGTVGLIEHARPDARGLPARGPAGAPRPGVLRLLYTSPGGWELISLTTPVAYRCAACGMPVESPVGGRGPARGVWVCPDCFPTRAR
jgi:DNA-directed RNA polymerase subunit RPC12/RpoP